MTLKLRWKWCGLSLIDSVYATSKLPSFSAETALQSGLFIIKTRIHLIVELLA